MKKIKVCVYNLCKLDVEDCVALRKKVEKVKSHDVSEFWHKRLLISCSRLPQACPKEH